MQTSFSSSKIYRYVAAPGTGLYLDKDGVLDAWCERGNIGALHQVARHRRQLYHLPLAYHKKDVRIKKC
jgi:hypothetical protein